MKTNMNCTEFYRIEEEALFIFKWDGIILFWIELKTVGDEDLFCLFAHNKEDRLSGHYFISNALVHFFELFSVMEADQPGNLSIEFSHEYKNKYLNAMSIFENKNNAG